MKILTLILLCILSICSLSVKESVNEYLEKLQDSNIGKMVYNLFELQNQNTLNVNPILKALDELNAFLNNQLKEENQDFKEYQVQHKKILAIYNKNKESALYDVTYTQNYIQIDLNPAKKKNEQLLKNINKDIQNQNEMIQKAEDNRVQDSKDFKEQQSNFEKCQNAIKEAIPLMSKLTNQKQSLIQTQIKSQFVRIQEDLVSSLQNLGKKSIGYSISSAMQHVFLQQNISNQNLVEQIIRLLNDILNKNEQAIESLIEEEAKSLAGYKKKISNLNKMINNLLEQKSKIENDLIYLKEQLFQYGKFLKQRQEELEIENKNIEKENNFQSQRAQQNTDLNSQVLKELKIVEECKKAIVAGNFVETTSLLEKITKYQINQCRWIEYNQEQEISCPQNCKNGIITQFQLANFGQAPNCPANGIDLKINNQCSLDYRMYAEKRCLNQGKCVYLCHHENLGAVCLDQKKYCKAVYTCTCEK